MSNTLINSVLRLITAGSVDDGKSTLIGRLLYDSHALLADQIEQLGHKKNANASADLNFATLTDGLAAEREQGITIDVAYRYFSTNKRKFILADTPGHEQYTRNMVTGASTADAAIILIDATRLDFTAKELELLPQTKRHSALLKLLGCPNLIIAVNKLDLLDYDENKFIAIKTAYQKIMQNLKIEHAIFIPISALKGDNIVEKSTNMPWYKDEPLLSILNKLESLSSLSHYDDLPAYFPVQKVLRQDGSTLEYFRGYQGRIEQGVLKPGDTVYIYPSKQQTTIKEIYDTEDLTQKIQTENVATIVLADEIDISRGDAIIGEKFPHEPTKKIQAMVCWLDNLALNPNRKYLLKQTTCTVPVKIKNILTILDIKTLNANTEQKEVKMNDIAELQLLLQQPITASLYQENRATGSFILIDDVSNQTVAAGMIGHLDY